MSYYLLTRETYEKLYDKLTVFYCRLEEESVLYQNRHKSKQVARELARKAVLQEMLERYENKQYEIERDIQRGTELDEMLQEFEPPQNVRCKRCGRTMRLSHRSFEYSRSREQCWDTDEPLFHFSCIRKCGALRVLYLDGTDRQEQKFVCPECNADLEEICSITEDNIELCVLTCGDCDYEELLETDHSEKEDPNLQADIQRFCLTHENAAALKRALDPTTTKQCEQ